MAGFNVSDSSHKTKPNPAYHDKEFVRSLAGDRTEMATAKESATAPITYSKEALEAASAAVPHMQRGHGAQTISPAMERTLRQAQDYLRRKMDKITTPMLRAISNNGEAGYQNEDIVSGERFYLTVDEVKRELERRDGVALNLAGEMYEAYRQCKPFAEGDGAEIPPWSCLLRESKITEAWKASAECVIEKYRCLL